LKLQVTKPQIRFATSKAKYPAILGGLGSGKSQGGTIRAVMLLLREPGINIAYYMPTYDLINLRAMPGVEEILISMGIPYKVNKSRYIITVLGYGDIVFRSYDNPQRIVAYEVAHSIVDELDTLKKDKAAYVWRKVDERNRQPTNWPTSNTLANVTTPDQGFSGFTYWRWVKEPLPSSELIKAPTWSNPFLPAGYIAQIRNNYDPLLADMYIEGEFVSLTQNKVYHFFDRNKNHTSRKLEASDQVIHVSIDFNVGGCCATINLIQDNNPIAVKEFVSNNTQEFVLKLEQYRPLPDGSKRRIIVYPDSSGGNESANAPLSSIALIRQAGFTVDCPASNPLIRDRVNSVNASFSHERAYVNTDECPRLTEALETQGYDTKGKPEKFDTHPAIDDWTDSYGYFMHRKFPIIKPVIITGIGMAQ